MDCEKVTTTIVAWLKEKSEEAKKDGFVLGVSGGVDSGLVSTLCAETGMKTICLNMPIRQAADQYDRAEAHINWLKSKYSNVLGYEIQLDGVFSGLIEDIEESDLFEIARNNLAMANSRSRLRMIALYACACHHNLLVAGTGNLVEDMGIGFFTKFGDGAVDLSPIGDLMKSEVRTLARHLKVDKNIVEAIPTDGLWEDNRSDEEAVGASYNELEWAMIYTDWWRLSLEKGPSPINLGGQEYYTVGGTEEDLLTSYKKLNDRQKKVLEIYCKKHEACRHKMVMPPVCKITGLKEWRHGLVS